MTTGVNGLEEVYKFSQDGFFRNEVGDTCARATAKVLKIPIAFISALPSIPTVPFLSHEFLTTTPSSGYSTGHGAARQIFTTSHDAEANSCF